MSTVATVSASLMLLFGPSSLAQVMQCASRGCLPEDTAERGQKKLCFTTTGAAESFARCPGDRSNSCVRCSQEPPCESWCEEAVDETKELGEPCHFDRECALEGFVQCHLGLCRTVTWTGQTCEATSAHSMCLYGQQACVNGRCSGLGTNQPCWDGYPDGRDLDCRIGWYCLRGVCVPQLPNAHTCYGEHPNECIRGHRCNLANERPQCTEEYSLEVGMRSSTIHLCSTSHISPRTLECAEVPLQQNLGVDCYEQSDCVRSDNSPGICVCKQWWDGVGAPGFCEIIMPHKQRPAFMEFWNMRKLRCHHNWPDERCARELGEHPLYMRVKEESQASADRTVIEECAYDVLDVVKTMAFRKHCQLFVWILIALVADNLV